MSGIKKKKKWIRDVCKRRSGVRWKLKVNWVDWKRENVWCVKIRNKFVWIRNGEMKL